VAPAVAESGIVDDARRNDDDDDRAVTLLNLHINQSILVIKIVVFAVF